MTRSHFGALLYDLPKKLGSFYPSRAAQAAVLFTLSLPQIYLLPRNTVDISLATLVTFLVTPLLLINAERDVMRKLLRTGLILVLFGLLAIRILALTWSLHPRAGLSPIVLLCQFVVTLILMVHLLKEHPRPFKLLQRAYWPWVILEAGLVILFRLAPNVEDAFLRSIGSFFAGANTIAGLYGESPNNVFDTAKSGGVFVNANVAAMFLGVNALAAFAISSLTRSRGARIIGFIALAAVPFTGSKSSMVLAMALPSIAFVIPQIYRLAALPRYALIASAATGSILVLLLTINSDLGAAMREAFLGRTVLWSFGVDAFRDSPALGLGYGGWSEGFAEYGPAHGLHRNFPPHNFLLSAWAITGLVGLALTILFVAILLSLPFKRAGSKGLAIRDFSSYAAAAFAWVVIQGMGENTDIFGEIHLIPVMSVLIAYLIWFGGEEPKGNGEAVSDCRNSKTSTVSAIGNLHS